MFTIVKEFDVAGSWSCSNEYVQNAMIHDVNISSSRHFNNCRNSVLILGEGPLMRSVIILMKSKRKFSINVINTKTIFCLVCITMTMKTICMFLKI